ncbi:MAG: hypothetical protein NZ820_12630 [Dehalococcoidia bacterium]|nr:hypothetical protein [Dehalococcoidia bacterium]
MEFKDTTYLRIEHYSNHPEVKAAADILVEKYAEDREFIKARHKWVSSARKLVASVWIHEDDLFRFGTKKDYFSAGSRKQVWMTPKTLKLFKLMESIDWIVKVKSEIRPKNSKKTKGGLPSIYQRQDSFKQLLKSLNESDIQIDEELPLVTLVDENNQYMELDERYLQTDSYKRTVTILNNHCQILKDSEIKDKEGNTLRDDMLRYRRKFKVDMGTGGRFYSPFCVLPKKERLSITINQEPVGSLDFSQLHPTLILLLNKSVGKETNLFATDDIYHMPDYPNLPRQAHKKFINTILNAKNKESAARSIATAEEYWDLIEDAPVFITYSGKAKRLRNPVWPDKPLEHATNYVDDFLFRHPDFEQAAYGAMWGILQLIDSSIIEYTINKATENNIPALPVHDEVVIPRQFKGQVGGYMMDGFHSVTQDRFKSHVPQIAWTTEV